MPTSKPQPTVSVLLWLGATEVGNLLAYCGLVWVYFKTPPKPWFGLAWAVVLYGLWRSRKDEKNGCCASSIGHMGCPVSCTAATL